MLNKLKGWQVDEADVRKIILKLQEEKFLDDRRYAGIYVRDKFRLNQWGKIKIKAMLRQKGINEVVIGEALDQIDEESYTRVCSALIHQKASSLSETDTFTRKGKLFRYASGRGFESELIHRILNM